MDKLDRVQAFHFKGGQGAKTGTGRIPIGFKLSAQHIEADIDAALCGAMGIQVTVPDQLVDAPSVALDHDGPSLVEIMADPALV